MAGRRTQFDVVIIGSGPAGLGAAFELAQKSSLRILMLDKRKICSGGLRNDCKQNYSYPVGFPKKFWLAEEAQQLLKEVELHLSPQIHTITHLNRYMKRAEKLGVELLKIRQAHVGTDQARGLILQLHNQLKRLGVTLRLESEVTDIDDKNHTIGIYGNSDRVQFEHIIVAPGRAAFRWLQRRMDELEVPYVDNIVDVGIRVETALTNYDIVKDYYDPKFLFDNAVRTFCTNSGAAFVVKESYDSWFSVNGHSFSEKRRQNGLVNFALLKTIELTDPVVSGHQFAEILGKMAMQLSGGKPMMQRIGDFRLGKRSKKSTFNSDLYTFKPTLKDATPGDISLAIPSKIMRDLWRSLKTLDTIVPGVLHPATIIYYPEIKTYANRPEFINRNFAVKPNLYLIGDGAGTSRGITAAWASGIRCAQGILTSL